MATFDVTKHNLNERLASTKPHLDRVKSKGFRLTDTWRLTWSKHTDDFFGQSPLSWERLLRSVNPGNPFHDDPIPILYLDPTPVDWGTQCCFKPTPVETAALIRATGDTCLYPGTPLHVFFDFCARNSIDVFPYYEAVDYGETPEDMLHDTFEAWCRAYVAWGRDLGYPMTRDEWGLVYSDGDKKPATVTFTQAWFPGETDDPAAWTAWADGWSKGTYPCNASPVSQCEIVWHHAVVGEDPKTTFGLSGIEDYREHNRRIRSGELRAENVYMPIISFAVPPRGGRRQGTHGRPPFVKRCGGPSTENC